MCIDAQTTYNRNNNHSDGEHELDLMMKVSTSGLRPESETAGYANERLDYTQIGKRLGSSLGSVCIRCFEACTGGRPMFHHTPLVLYCDRKEHPPSDILYESIRAWRHESNVKGALIGISVMGDYHSQHSLSTFPGHMVRERFPMSNQGDRKACQQFIDSYCSLACQGFRELIKYILSLHCIGNYITWDMSRGHDSLPLVDVLVGRAYHTINHDILPKVLDHGQRKRIEYALQHRVDSDGFEQVYCNIFAKSKLQEFWQADNIQKPSLLKFRGAGMRAIKSVRFQFPESLIKIPMSHYDTNPNHLLVCQSLLRGSRSVVIAPNCQHVEPRYAPRSEQTRLGPAEVLLISKSIDKDPYNYNGQSGYHDGGIVYDESPDHLIVLQEFDNAMSQMTTALRHYTLNEIDQITLDSIDQERLSKLINL
eukprot:gene2282-2588_t